MKKLGNKSSGIYYIRVNGKIYVGKDHDINRLKRIKEHKNHLKQNKHHHQLMQESYNKNNDFEYGVLLDYGHPVDDSILCQDEIYWIEKTKAYTDGWNRTLGGIGGSGVKYTEEQLHSKSKRVSDDKNPMSKISLNEFLEIIKMIQNGYNNLEIGKKFNLHDRYISLIRNKKRHKNWFDEYAPNYKVISGKKFQAHNKLSDDKINEIKNIIQTTAETNVSIAKKYEVNPSTISRLRTKFKREE